MDAKALQDLVATLCSAIRTKEDTDRARFLALSTTGLLLQVDADGYRIGTEGDRGHVYFSEPEPSLDVFLYRLMHGYVSLVTFVPEQEELDVRRLSFPRTLEILEQLNPAWAKRAEEEQHRELEEKPFDDYRIRRREHAFELCLYQRLPDAEAKRMAAEKYPKPEPKRAKATH